MAEPEHLRLNRANWEDRAVAHAEHGGYDLAAFRDPDHLTDVVRFDLPRLGDVRGLRGVHLQCHLGTDTVSLARLGARMSGLDFSARAVAYARRLAEDAGVSLDLHEADVHDAVEVLGAGEFDLVYTGIGALCWLPSVDRWAGVVAGLLRPGGRLFLREGHPMLWALADAREDGLLAVELPYFEQEAPTVWDEATTYVDVGEHRIEASVTHEWNHGLGEVVTALQRHGMRLLSLEEHDSAPWAFLGGQSPPHPELPGEYRLADRPERLPATYTLVAVREG